MSLVTFSSPTDRADKELVGGKGLELINLTRAGFPVPPGFIITTDAYMYDISDQTLERWLQAFDELGAEFVAVRSSAVMEDGQKAAWAGQLETFLYVDRDSFAEAVQQCWVSLYSPRAQAYAKKIKVDPKKNRVAVVVQSMVDSDVAGVAFSRHPVTGGEQVMIEAGIGLGEAVVSGAITPDNYVIDRSGGAQKTISKQTKVLRRGKSGKTAWHEVGADLQSAQKLTEKQLGELHAAIIAIENHYGYPVDVEWTFVGDKLWILQARPITTGGRW